MRWSLRTYAVKIRIHMPYIYLQMLCQKLCPNSVFHGRDHSKQVIESATFSSPTHIPIHSLTRSLTPSFFVPSLLSSFINFTHARVHGSHIKSHTLSIVHSVSFTQFYSLDLIQPISLIQSHSFNLSRSMSFMQSHP